ncbi:MAG TPA: CoA transferase, partial [Chloroflexota bacterium]|nr:CoA transferase [Chloroflexota bacterium]
MAAPPRRPLDGVRVLELANFMAGPYCGMVLADLGADVIKVESPRGGDFSRATGPFVGGESAGFLTLNRNKRSLALDLKTERGQAIFLDLVRTADVLVENFRPGTMDALGLDYATLAALNPRLIYSSASGFGQSGPYRERPALDLIVQGLSGLMSITGEPGRPPVKVGVPIADLTAALFGANAILAALYVRDRTGEGQRIDVSLLESALALEVWETSGYFATGEVPEPLGSAHRVTAPYQAIRTADGYVTIGASTPKSWTALCAALGLEHLEHDERFATVPARRARYQELAALIEAVTITQPSEHWHALLERAGVPCGVLN